VFLFFFFFQLLLVVTPKKQRLMWILLSLATPIALLLYEYYHPDKIRFSYESKADRFADTIFTFAFTFFFICYITIELRSQFEYERKLVKGHADVIGQKMLELHKSEASLQAFFQNTRNVYILLDGNMNLITFNEAAQELARAFGCADLIGGENIFAYIQASKRTFFFNKMELALQGAAVEFEHKVERGDYVQWWYVQFNPVFTGTKDVIGIACTGSNINERKEQEQRILTKNEALMQIAHYQSHNMRGPVTSIMGLLSILKEERENAPEECYTLLNEAVNRLDAQIHKVIDLTNGLTD